VVVSLDSRVSLNVGARPLLRVPFVVVVLLVLLHVRRIGDRVRGFLARGVATAVVGVPVLVPGAVERLLVDLLRVLRDVVAHGFGEAGDAVVGHGDAPSRGTFDYRHAWLKPR